MVPKLRVSAARRAGSLSEGTRMVAAIPALPMSMPQPGPGTAARPSPLPRVPPLLDWAVSLRGGTARGTGGERKKLTRVLERNIERPLG